RHDESPTVISRRHAQHVSRGVQLRQLAPILETSKLDSFAHRLKRARDRACESAGAGDFQAHVWKLTREPHKRARQQVNAFPPDERSRKQKHAARSISAALTRKPIEVGKVRQVLIDALRAELIPVLLYGKLPDAPDRHVRAMQRLQFP